MFPTRAEGWKTLLETAARQDGVFTQQQALCCGVSKQLLQYHLRKGRLVRRTRGVYRLHLPEVQECSR